MKRVIALLAVLLAVAAAGSIMLRLRATAEAQKAVSAEANGDYSQALAYYTTALDKIVPSVAVPDINRSKALPPATWKKEVDDYAAWLLGTSAAVNERTKTATLLDGIGRNAPRADTNNFLSNASVKGIDAPQFTSLWESAFFAPGVKVDAGHLSLATRYFGKGLSIIKLTAHTTYTYEISLIDTAANRRTSFAVYPESSTFVLTAPGTHLLVCKSSFKPGPGTIWYSSPSVIPLSIPETPSLLSYTLETSVKRAEGKR